MTHFTRRQFLRDAAILAALAASPAAFAKSASPYGPFRMGIQSYSLRGFKLDEALEKTQALGLTWWEGWDGHLPMTDDPKILAEYRGKLKAHKIKMATYGVVGFNGNEADARRKFEFGKAMGISTFSADPSPDALPILDKLCDEYKINIAIHNHGPGARYDKISDVQKAMNGHNKRIGSCDDTGHFLRSKEDPVAAARQFGPRLYGVHLKDVRETADGGRQFTEVGKGLLDVAGLFAALKASNFPKRGLVSLEYEEHPDNPIPGIEECLAATRAVLKK